MYEPPQYTSKPLAVACGEGKVHLEMELLRGKAMVRNILILLFALLFLTEGQFS